jgi:hypothetical protein
MRPTEKLTANDIIWRYGGGPTEPKKIINTYACSYGLGCEGPDCPHEDCPRKSKK